MSSSDPVPVPADEAAALARTREARGLMGSRLSWYRSTGSTNDRALEAAHAGAPPGATFVAETQTGGRGRLGRVWASPPGAGLYFSVVIALRQATVPLATLATGVAMAEGIRAATGLAVQLKWPNDIWVDGRKAGGILAEAVRITTDPAIIVVGVGLNLAPAALPPEVEARATSLERECGRPVERGLVLAECLVSLRQWTDALDRGEGSAVLERWRHLAAPLLRRPVEWDEASGTGTGTAVDVDADGALIVETVAGRVTLRAGEVRWR